jgi:large subunit ribosomal protein L19
MFRIGMEPILRRDFAGVCRNRATNFSALFSTQPDIESMPYLHHGTRPRYRDQPKFKSPRKRASGLFNEIKEESIRLSKESRPKVWDVPFKVGDAIEIDVVAQGGVKSKDTEKMRGVVLGIFRKGLDHSVLIRDVVFGEPIERRIPLHSPLLRSLRVIEENFVFKGKRKVKRAKLYYLRDRNPLGTITSIRADIFLLRTLFCIETNFFFSQSLRLRSGEIRLNEYITLNSSIYYSITILYWRSVLEISLQLIQK